MPALQALQKKCAGLFATWSVENKGDHAKAELTPGTVFGKGPPRGQYYVSSILQKNGAGLKHFFAQVPFAEAPVLAKAKAAHDDGVWLFVGANEMPKKQAGKRKRVEPSVLGGRPEHTDAVDHSGTWHVQLKGHKTWYVRPCVDAHDWGSSPPELGTGKRGVVKEGRGGSKLKILCEEGDLLLINTRAWWHKTEIEPQDTDFSISYARDFYLGDNKKKKADGEKTNDETLDPRMFAARNFKAMEVVLREDELPDAEMPRSADPNCSMAELDDDSFALVSIRAVKTGEPLTIGVGEDSDDDEYEEWDLDPETGEMVKVLD